MNFIHTILFPFDSKEGEIDDMLSSLPDLDVEEIVKQSNRYCELMSEKSLYLDKDDAKYIVNWFRLNINLLIIKKQCIRRLLASFKLACLTLLDRKLIDESNLWLNYSLNSINMCDLEYIYEHLFNIGWIKLENINKNHFNYINFTDSDGIELRCNSIKPSYFLNDNESTLYLDMLAPTLVEAIEHIGKTERKLVT